MLTSQDMLTPRESILMEAETEQARLAREHEVTMKRLELETRVEIKKLDVRLGELKLELAQAEASAKRIPLLILRLFMVPFIGVGYIIAKLWGRDVDTGFWEFLR